MGKMVLMPPSLSRPFAPGLKGCMQNCSSSRLALCDLVAGRGLHVVGVHRGLAMHQVLNQLADLGVIRMGVTFGVLFRFPEAERQDAFCIRHEDDLIYEACLRLDFDNANKHSASPYPLSYEGRKPSVNTNGWERTLAIILALARDGRLPIPHRLERVQIR